MDIIDWWENNILRKDNFDRYLREVAREEKKIQPEQRVIAVFAQSERRDEEQKQRNTHHTRPFGQTTKLGKDTLGIPRLYVELTDWT